MSKILNIQFDIEKKTITITQIPKQLREHEEFIKLILNWDLKEFLSIMDDDAE